MKGFKIGLFAAAAALAACGGGGGGGGSALPVTGGGGGVTSTPTPTPTPAPTFAPANKGVAFISAESSSSIQQARGIQVLQLEDINGNALAKPTYKLAAFPNYVMGMDATPDGKYGIVVYGAQLEPNSVQLVSGFDGANPVPVGSAFDVYNDIGVPGAAAMLPNADRALVTQENTDSPGKFDSLSGVTAGTLAVGGTLTVEPTSSSGTIQPVSIHRYVHVASDGSYAIFRGGTNTVVRTLTKNPSGTYSYNYATTLTGIGKNTDAQGNGGFAIDPKDPSQAIFVSGSVGNDVYYVTGLPSNPQVTHFLTPEAAQLSSVQFTPDGKFAVIGGANGVQVYGGFGTGSLTRVGGVYAGTVTMEDGVAHPIAGVTSVGVTPDGKYVAAVVTAKNGSGQLIGSLVTLGIDASGNLTGPLGVRNQIVPPTMPDDVMIVR
ncbi:MAG TPA: hypothetical protein VJP85_00620 [Candidatus Baltobacteraceae bacterium]|nr:hypothetical protein [Candidatus Baltobacteraceae bacterium]